MAFFESFWRCIKKMAGAIAVQQHDDIVNLPTIWQKTEYRFAFGKYVIQVSLWHQLDKDNQFFINIPLKWSSMRVVHKKRENLATFLALHRRSIWKDAHSNLIYSTIRLEPWANICFYLEIGDFLILSVKSCFTLKKLFLNVIFQSF